MWLQGVHVPHYTHLASCVGSLYQKIDMERLECLNESEEGSGKTVFKAWDDRQDKTKVWGSQGYYSNKSTPSPPPPLPFTHTMLVCGE